jgi:hypothetical protein
MFFKKSIKKLEKEIKTYLEKGDYRYVSMLYESNGHKELAKKYYNIFADKAIEKIYLKNIKEETVFPSEECHNDLINYTFPRIPLEMNLEKHYIRN